MPDARNDPQRIEPVLAALRKAWYEHPYMRLGQLIVNASDRLDPFHVDDRELRGALERYGS